VPDDLEDLRYQIIAGQTSREEVEKRLGKAFINQEQVEVYQVVSGLDVTLEGPVIPMFWDTEEVIIYALVVYDKNNVVEEIDWDVYRHDRESIPVNTSTWLRSAKLNAGEFYFAAYKNGPGMGQRRKEILLSPISLSQSALHTPPPAGMCAVLFFLYETDRDRWLHGELYIDDESTVEMPLIDSVYWYWASPEYWAPYYQHVFTKAQVAEGKHEVRLTTSLKPREFRRQFICKPGRILYVYPQIELVEAEPWGVWRRKFRYEGEITVNSEPLESHDGWKRLLFYNGKWIGED
jgi:hypothetical protein